MKQQQKRHSAVTVFYSYAYTDEALRDQLAKHLSQLKHEGLIAEWHDRQISAGTDWAQNIDEHLETASIILLLISADFLASRYCYDIEMQRAMERHRLGECHVIPILLRPCDWHNAPFGQLQCLPRDDQAITSWQNQDQAFQTIARELRRIIEHVRGPQLAPLDQRNRQILLKRVRKIWIEGLLEHSLHHAALIVLNLQEQPDALVNPWQFQVQEINTVPRVLPTGTSIVQIYDDAESLLILGEPGAGKTTVLLELTRELLQRAEDDPRHLLPVVFNLSSWSEKCPPLADWFIEELRAKYQVSREIAATFLATNQLLPLLDGLDEVAPHARSACVEAINTYCQTVLEKGSFLPLVVCCRSRDYHALPLRVHLDRAVSLQPLTDEQIERYLESTHGQLDALRDVLQDDADLRELTHRPLMLSIFTMAYQGAHAVDLPVGHSSQAKQQQLFATYVERMLTRRGELKDGKEQFTHWLTFLARQLHRHHQTVFAVEELQPDWLPDTPRRLYQWSIVLVGGLVGGLETTIKPAEVLTWSWKEARSGLVVVLLFVLLFVLVGRLVVWLLGGLVAGLSRKQLAERLHLSPNEGIWRSAKHGLFLGLFGGLFVGLLFGLVVGLAAGLVVGLFVGLLVGLFVGLAAFVQHIALRLWLWRGGYLPWDVVAFLDEAAERLLLSKVGGSYIFVHRLLLDYFASLDQPVPSESMSPADTT